MPYQKGEICERHNVLKRSCEICDLEEERDRYKRGLEEICEMQKYNGKEVPVLDHWGMIALAKYVLDLNNKY